MTYYANNLWPNWEKYQMSQNPFIYNIESQPFMSHSFVAALIYILKALSKKNKNHAMDYP